jgi:hypothetical protein
MVKNEVQARKQQFYAQFHYQTNVIRRVVNFINLCNVQVRDLEINFAFSADSGGQNIVSDQLRLVNDFDSNPPLRCEMLR